MKVLLVYPTIGLSPSYSCGVGYVGAVLREAGHAVRYRRLAAKEDIATFCQDVADYAPGLIGFSATSCQFEQLKSVIPLVRAQTTATLVCGGIHPTVQPDCLEEIPTLDAIVRGEGEEPLRELAAAVAAGRDYSRVPNVWSRSGGVVVRNEMRPLISNLDILPFPDRDNADTQRVIDHELGMHRMIFSRGCSFQCPYCSNEVMSQLYRGKGTYHRIRSPAKALEEIERDVAALKFRFLFFDDDTITMDRDWFTEFFTLYPQRFKIPFYCNLRPGTLTAPMARLLSAAGAKGVALGIEHGDEEFRRKVLGRNLGNDGIRQTVELCRSAGIAEVYGQVMIGLPFETVELHLQTVRLCRTLEIIPFRYIYQPYPGTSLARICEQNHWIPEKSIYVERREAVIDFPQFSREQIQTCFDVFSLLVRLKFLPLRLPGLPPARLLQSYRFLTAWMLPALRELCGSVGFLRRWVVYRPQA